jgi:hypothetical protein
VEAECEVALSAVLKTPAIPPPPASISRYLENLRSALETDTDRARPLLAKVTFCRDGNRLLADVKGNLANVLKRE